MAVLETSRLLLRPFREEDIDLMAPLMANPDFMRFSLGIFAREQTAAFLDKVVGWQRRGLPSQFAVIHRSDNRLIGYCGFVHQEVDGIEEIEIGYRLDPDYWNRGFATETAHAKMLAHFCHHLCAEVGSTVEHCHYNTTNLKPVVRAGIAHLLD